MLELDIRTRQEKMVEGYSVPVILGKNRLNNPLIIENDYDLRTPKIFVADANNAHEILRFANRGYQTFKIDGLPGKILANSSNTPVIDSPISHDGSGSLYYMDKRVGKHRLLVSFLPSGEWTSELHWHPQELKLTKESDWKPEGIRLVWDRERGLYVPPEGVDTQITEFYELNYGSAKIHHSEHDDGYIVPGIFSVGAGIGHGMEAGPEGAILGIMMKNAGLYPLEFQHIPLVNHQQAA